MSMTTAGHRAEHSASHDSQVEDLLARMTLAEKVGQLHLAGDLDPESSRELIAAGAVGGGVFSHGAHRGPVETGADLAEVTSGCQRTAIAESRLGIPLLFGSDITHGVHTTFPIPLGAAASWDPELVAATAARAAAEARRDGIALSFAPMIDIATDHRWGRVGETLGEDPLLVSRMGVAMVRGLQESGRFAAAVKHFCGYGLVQADRDLQTLSIGPNALHNVHLRPFRAAVEAGCRAVMVGVHDIDGIPMHANDTMVRGLLKDQWGFDGVVISEWAGIRQLVHQGVARDLRDAARQAMNAGVDLDLASGAYQEHLGDLVTVGEVPSELVDDAVRRVLRLKFALGLFDGEESAATPVFAESADDLAKRAGAAAAVLVKNSGAILPLHGNLGRVHLCGPFVHDTHALLGAWVFDDSRTGISTAGALAEQIDSQELLVSDGRFADEALRNSFAADLTVVMVGEHPVRSGEDRCLPVADLPAGQLELLRSLADAGKPLVAVVVAGRPLDLQPVLELADAVLMVWHPGAQAGSAIVDVLTGRTVPSGRLPTSLPRVALQGTMERTTGRRLGRAQDTKFGGYLNALAHPELSLGFGLGYTSFAYSDVELSRERLAIRGGVVRASVEVANIGPRPGREVVQLYISDLVAEVVRPLIELADWQVVELDPGQTRRVTFRITAEQLGYWGRSLEWRVDDGAVDVIIGPNAARGTSARLEVTS